MTINNKYIGRSEVAKILGVSHETVANYIRKGVFQCKTIGNNKYIERESFEAHLDEIKELARDESSVEYLRQELEEEATNLRKNIKLLKREVSRMDVMGRLYKKSFVAIVRAIEKAGKMKPQDLEVLDLFWQNADYATIAELLNIAEKNVSVAISLRLEKAVRCIHNLTNTHEEELTNLRRRVALQHEHITSLQAENDKLQALLAQSEYASDPMVHCHGNPERVLFIQSQLIEHDLPVRVLNCMRCFDAKTVNDLVSLTEERVKSVHNIGKKTLYEINTFLNKNGLHLGMTDKQIKKWLREE